MAYNSELATQLAKEVKSELQRLEARGQCWCGMTRWLLWTAAAKQGLVEMLDKTTAQWGNLDGIKVKPGNKRTLDVAWRRIFAD